MSSDSCEDQKKGLLNREKKEHHSQEDLDILDQFCSELKIEEIEYDDWHTHHRKLNLTVCLFLTMEELTLGGEKEVKYCRTIKKMTGGKKEETRQQASCLVKWPPGAEKGHHVSVKGKGDEKNGDQGDLLVKIILK